MAFLSARAAAQLTGKSKSTILRAIRSGRLPAMMAADRAFSIDLVELRRVFPGARAASDAECFTDPPAQKAAPTNPDAIVPDSNAPLAFVEIGIEQARDRCRTRAQHEALARSVAEARPWWASAASNATVFCRGIISIGLAYRAKLLEFANKLHPWRGSQIERRGEAL